MKNITKIVVLSRKHENLRGQKKNYLKNWKCPNVKQFQYFPTFFEDPLTLPTMKTVDATFHIPSDYSAEFYFGKLKSFLV